jgi:hypothetical protein
MVMPSDGEISTLPNSGVRAEVGDGEFLGTNGIDVSGMQPPIAVARAAMTVSIPGNVSKIDRDFSSLLLFLFDIGFYLFLIAQGLYYGIMR